MALCKLDERGSRDRASSVNKENAKRSSDTVDPPKRLRRTGGLEGAARVYCEMRYEANFARESFWWSQN